jgi:hypothetical protein
MVEICPMRRQLHQDAFLFEDLAVGLTHQRQGRRGTQPACLTIEHTFILEGGTDIDDGSTDTNFLISSFRLKSAPVPGWQRPGKRVRSDHPDGPRAKCVCTFQLFHVPSGESHAIGFHDEIFGEPAYFCFWS